MRKSFLLIIYSFLTLTLLLQNLFICPKSLAGKTPKSETPTVLLLSIDGYRYDYTEKFQPPFLSKWIKKDAANAKSLKPIYPSKTFPNHYSIVTGMYAEKHGIVDNSFYSHDLDLKFSLHSREVKNASWYKGDPLWVLAKKQGLLSASYFWPGSDVNDEAKRPNYYRNYKHSTPEKKRIDQIITWLKLPASKRPNFLTLYFSQVDESGHHHGPLAAETKRAVLHVDYLLKYLWEKLETLDKKVNLVLVSDHGMESLKNSIPLYLNNYMPLDERVRVLGAGPFLKLYIKDQEYQKEVMQKLSVMPHVKAYLRKDIPESYHIKNNALFGDILIETEYPYSLSQKQYPNQNKLLGAHGYNPETNKNMHGIFYAKGPNIKPNNSIESFENIHVAPFILDLLKLDIPENMDGKSDVLKNIVKFN